MSTWSALLDKFSRVDPNYRAQWLSDHIRESLEQVAEKCDGRNVLLYGSAFLQKPFVPGYMLSITPEDINGLMATVYGMDCSRGLTLIVHTPGGQIDATESIVEYLKSKFDDIEAVVPTFAMSAGTMISLATRKIWLGKHSQLGPIDPQMVLPDGRAMSAQGVVDQFRQAHDEILETLDSAHVWAPMLPAFAPALLKEAENALAHSRELVGGWLATGMFRGKPNAASLGDEVASRFNDAGQHKSHGKRIGYEESKSWGVCVGRLEEDQSFQEAILTTYHLMTLLFEQTYCVKVLMGNNSQIWMKHFQTYEERAAGHFDEDNP